jgi:hypothetical protein
VGNTLDINMGADAKKVIREFERITAENAKLTAQLQKMGEKGKEGGGKVKEGLGSVDSAISTSIRSIVSWGASFASVGTIVNEIKSGLDYIAQERLMAMGVGASNAMAYAGLSQFGATKAPVLKAQAESLWGGEGATEKMRGAKDLDQAAAIVEALEAGGRNTEENREFLRSQYTVMKGETLQFAKDAGQLIRVFGETETGGLKAIADKALALREAGLTGMPAHELAGKSAETAAAASLIGWTSKENMAVQAVLSKSLGAEKASSAMNAMMIALTKEESMAGKPLPAKLGVLKEGKFTDERMRQLLEPELAARLEAALPSLKMKEGGKTTHPFKGLSLTESMEKAAGFTEAETKQAFGPFAEEINAALEKNTSFVGKGAVNTIKEIIAKGYTEQELTGIFSRRSVLGFTELSKNMPLLEQALAVQEGAQGKAGMAATTAMGMPEVRSAEAAASAVQRGELADKGMGIMGNYAKAAVEGVLADMEKRGVSHFTQERFKRWAERVQYYKGEEGAKSVIQTTGTIALQKTALGPGSVNREVSPTPTAIDVIRGTRQEQRARENAEPARGIFLSMMDVIVARLGELTEKSANAQAQASDAQIKAADAMNRLAGQRSPSALQGAPAAATGVDRR